MSKVTKLGPSVLPSPSVDTTCVELSYLSLQSLFSQAQAQNLNPTPVNSHVTSPSTKFKGATANPVLHNFTWACPQLGLWISSSQDKPFVWMLLFKVWIVFSLSTSFIFLFSAPTLQQVRQVEVVTFQDPRKKLKTKETPTAVNVSVRIQDILCTDF